VNHYHISPKKIRVVHLAAGEEFHPSIPEEEIDALRQRYGLQKPYFLFVGSIHPRKNLGILLEAFTSVLSAYPGPISLVIAGQPGFKGQQIMHQAGDLPVQFLGYIPGPDLPMLMAGAVALVFPSLYEGFGLPALEAMASGIPVVAANVSSLPEIVGDAGLFADPRRPVEWAQAMLSLLTDEESRSRLIKRGLARAQQFSWQRCAQETMNVLVEALEK
jgi:glycosyltransferase involved in cell wall biosynthesis